MLTKVLIKRRFRKGNEKEILHLLRELRAKAMEMPGYLSGVSLTAVEDPRQILVISTWEKLDHWRAWKESAARKTIEAMLEVYQDAPASYEAYLVGRTLADGG